MSVHQSFSKHNPCHHTAPPRLELVSPRGTYEVEKPIPETSHCTQEEVLWERKLYENTPRVYMTLDRTGTILSVNQQGASSLGYLPQELIQKPVFQLFNQTEQKTLIDNFINLFQDSSKGEVGNWELSLNCPASKMRAVKVAAEILHATQDSQQLILMVLEDITHEKLTAGTLQESEQQLRLLADIIPVMLWMAGPDGLYNFFNRSWLEFTGNRGQQQQEFGCWHEVHPKDKNSCQQTYESAWRTQTRFQYECRCKRWDGEYRWILNTGVPRFHPTGGFLGYIGTAVDITEHKLAEIAWQESQKAARVQIDELLNTVSHELRTPLTNMKMAIQMLGIALNREHNLCLETAFSSAESSPAARYFQILTNECDREINLINNFLDLQRPDASTKPLILEKIQIEQWLEQVVELFKVRNFLAWRHKLDLQVAPYIPLFVCDPHSLERILLELLSNACKFSPPGAEIIIAAKSKSSCLQLQVSNSGVEIPASELPHIFDKFYRIPSNDPCRQGGTGLGLALVQKLTKYLGGTIQVESESNRTCFTIQLPFEARS